MLYIKRTDTNPYFNIAAEEYVLKNFSEDCFMLWRNEASVIVGKHQNSLAEINLDFIEINNIPVVRRISGGGAVFHDLGNLNFTFIKNAIPEKLVDFRKYTDPIIAALASMGINAHFGSRNELSINGKKISGNAEHVYHNRVLHHGTLLFETKLNMLSEALNADQSKFEDKAVKSIRSQVSNISEYLSKPISIMKFEKMIYEHVLKSDNQAKFHKFNAQDIKNINELVNSKYARWDWNYAYSPKYNFNKKVETKVGCINFNLDIKNGIIRKIELKSDTIDHQSLKNIEKLLIGKLHRKEKIEIILKQKKFQNYFKNIKPYEIINGLF